MSLKPKKRKQRSPLGSKKKRDTIESKGWKQEGDDWRWTNGKYEVSVYLDDEGFYNVDIWKSGTTDFVNVDVSKSKRTIFKVALRLMLENKVDTFWGKEK